MHPIIQSYMKLVDFLGNFLGNDCEVALHDFTEGSYSIVAIVNGHISGRKVGAPLTELGLKFVKEKVYENVDYKMNYRGKSSTNDDLRCATLFIKDETGNLIGMLCINCDTQKSMQILEELKVLMHLSAPAEILPKPNVPPEPPHNTPDMGEGNVELFSDSIENMVSTIIQQAVEDFNYPRERLTANEKMEIVNVLNQRGVFMLKSSVGIVASELNSSEASIYRYLNKLNYHSGKHDR